MLTLANSMSDFGPQEKPLFTDPPNQLQDHTSKFLHTIITLHVQPGQLAAFHNLHRGLPVEQPVVLLTHSKVTLLRN